MQGGSARLRNWVMGLGLAVMPALGGTDLPAPLRVGIDAVAGGGFELRWTDLGPDRAYTVQVATAATGIWITPEWRWTWPIPQPTWQDPHPDPSGIRFHRVLAVEPPERGALREQEFLGGFTPAQIQTLLGLAGVSFLPRWSVEIHRLIYETIDPWGGRTLASGALAMPVGQSEPSPLVCYQHGTLAARHEAPSQAGGLELLLGVAFASVGYVAVLPDYLGLGSSPLRHPYHHAKSQATAGVDMLRATRAVCAETGVALNGQLFVCGYSQGGHAALALLRELETFHPDEFPVTAAAPMAGAYDLAGVMADDLLSNRPQPNPYYAALLLAAYQDLYRLADRLEDLLIEPWRTLLPPLLDGEHTGSQINAVLPARVIDILQPGLVAALQADPRHPVRQALAANSLLDWRPRSPVRLYHCSGDRDVPFANALAARDAFHAQGALQVELIEPAPGADHSGCVAPSLLATLAWFDEWRTAGP